jgi:2-haloacid dehalogenase
MRHAGSSPPARPYERAAADLGAEVAGIRLVAAHAWDVAGALRAGAAAAFVARPGMILDPLVPAPDVIGSDMTEVADRIVDVELGR